MQQTSEDDMNRGAGPAGHPALLQRDIVSFLESGVSIVLGVVGPSGRALTGRALAARVTGARIRLIYAEEGNSAITATAQSGGPIAATFSAPLSHRTVQIKGFSSRHEALQPEDEASTRQQTDVFAGVLAAVGHSQAFVQAYCDYRSSPLWVISFPAEEAFEQTPGPGAGRSL